jgi:hypothetical protein
VDGVSGADRDEGAIDRGLDGLGYDKDGNYNPKADQSADAPKPAGKRATGKLPAWSPDESDGAERFAAWLNELYDPRAQDPFVGGERYGTHGDATLILRRASGKQIRWNHQATLTKPAGLQSVLMSECGIKPRKLTGYDTMLIAWVITRLCTLRAGLDPLEEVVLWWSRYIDSRPVHHADPDNEPEWRGALMAWQHAREADERHSPLTDERQTFILVDSRDDNRYVRREDFADHVRSIVKGSLSWPSLNSRVAEAGWQQTRFQRRATPSAPHVSVRVYVVPADWPEPTVGPSDDA